MNLFILISLLFIIVPAVEPDLASDRSALLALRTALGGRSLLWNVTSPDPCTFTGVTCESGRVTELHFPGMSLSGPLPENTLGNLTKLNTVSLRYNGLTGTVPADISSLSDLRNLYLQSNNFSGPIPDSLFSLPNLVRLNLASNQFTGPISTKFNSLNRLKTLYLENNNLSGPVPALNHSGLDQFNVSNNRLTGSIPVQLEKRPSGSFVGNSDLCGKPLDLCNGTTTHHKKNLSGQALAGIIVGSVLGLLLIIALLICCFLKTGSIKSGAKEVSAVANTSIPHKELQAPPRPASVLKKADPGLGDKKLVFLGKKGESGYDLEDLLRASAEVLGKGTFGTMYKVVMAGGMVVAVKRLKDVVATEKEFREKIEGVGRMENENFVPLRAYYFSEDEKLLVYDYMPMGSLFALLHGNRGMTAKSLDWETRSSIALGASRGLAYLHSQGPTVSHGNIKSSNILLTNSYEPLISDFGLSQFGGPTSTLNRVEGYRAPEVTDPRKVYQKADVYSFGVLVLELLTGKQVLSMSRKQSLVPPLMTGKATIHAGSNEEGINLVRWVQSVVREDWTNEVFDPELRRYHNFKDEMVQLLQLAIECLAEYPDNRPSMYDVSRRIQDLGQSNHVEDVFLDADEFSK